MPDATTDAGAGGRHRLRAFGLAIDSSFAAPGLAPLTGSPNLPATTVDLVPEAAIDDGWPAEGVERVLGETFDGEAVPARTIDVHPEAGYRLYARHFGLARISPDGARVLCAPPGPAEWDWQRFLVGRVLPWAAVLRGYEVFHASAVATGGRVAAFVGETGMGKTSLALRLVADGAGFVSDDVLAVETGPGGSVLAHAGAGIACVRPAEREAIPAATWGRLGTVLGHSGKTYMAVSVADGPLPLGAVYFLRAGGEEAIEPLPSVDPRLLLASTFVLGVQTPARLSNQLDVCAAIARGVPAFRLSLTAGGDSGALAARVSEHLAAVGASA
jgi:hypothetical protein